MTTDGNSDTPEMERLRRQRATLASFGDCALAATDLDALLLEACRLVSEAIEVTLVKVLELMPDQESLLVRAGVNWEPGVVGNATIGADIDSPAGYAIKIGKPVISPDVATETRFRIPDLLREHGVKSMVNVVIPSPGSAWGVLEVDSPTGRPFDDDDINFLQSFAHLIAAGIERLRTHQEIAELARHREILVSELRHRTLNILHNIRALARRTAAISEDLTEFTTAFEERLTALGRTQDLLARGSERPIDLGDLLRQELEAHGADEDGKVTIDGPSGIAMPAKVAQALGMAFHELATNASKHGALGKADGRIRVSWTREPGDGGDDILITWRETGVEIDAPPKRRSLGFEMIEQAVPYIVGGSTEIVFHKDGLECIMRLPLAELKTNEPR